MPSTKFLLRTYSGTINKQAERSDMDEERRPALKIAEHIEKLTKKSKIGYTNKGTKTRVIVLNSLIRTCNDGPAVSLKGSPTVSPVMAAI